MTENESKVIWKTLVLEGEKTNYSVSSNGFVRNDKSGKVLKGTYGRNEYHSVQLSIHGKLKSMMTHRLIALMFCPNPNNYPIVDHINRDKFDNRSCNLRWVTNEMNVRNSSKISTDECPTFYKGEISDFVDLSRSDKYLVSKDGIILNKNTRRILKGKERNGYIRVTIDGIPYSAHRLIWESFNGKITKNYVIDHIDGNRKNNRLANLRMVKQSENVENAYFNGHNAQKEVYQYSLDGEFIKKYNKLIDAATEFNCSVPAITSAVKRKGTCSGYFWSFEKLDINSQTLALMIKVNKTRSDAYGVTRYDVDGSNPIHYISLKEASLDTEVSVSTISRGAKGYKKAKGYYWILDSDKDNVCITDLI